MDAEPAVPALLRLRLPLGVSCGVAILLVLGVAGAGEAVARAGFLGDWLPPPSLGSGQAQLDKKITLVSGILRSGQSVDLIFLGNSQVHRGIDPVLFEEAFRQASGREVRSFNFGLGGAAEMSMAPLGKILIDKVHPKILVAGTSSFGLAEEKGVKFAGLLDASPWFRYHGGHFSLDGWLIDHSEGFRQYLGCLFWWEKRPKVKQKALEDSIQGMKDNGYTPAMEGPVKKINEWEARRLRNFKVSANHLEAMSQLLSLPSGVQTLVVELPLPESTINLYGGKKLDHLKALLALEQVAAKHGTPFWRFPSTLEIPEKDWYDYVHLNRIGAEVYSRWLGEKLGEAVREGRFKL